MSNERIENVGITIKVSSKLREEAKAVLKQEDLTLAFALKRCLRMIVENGNADFLLGSLKKE